MSYVPTVTVELKQYPELARIIRAASPSYKRHKVMVRQATTVKLQGTFWDDGSRSTYTAVRLSDGFSLGAPQYAPPQFGGPRVAPTVDIPVGVAIVETGIFRGKTATAYVIFNPADVCRFIESA